MLLVFFFSSPLLSPLKIAFAPLRCIVLHCTWRRHAVRGVRARAADGRARGGHRGDRRAHKPRRTLAPRAPSSRRVRGRRAAPTAVRASFDGRGTRLVGRTRTDRTQRKHLALHIFVQVQYIRHTVLAHALTQSRGRAGGPRGAL